MQLSKDRFFQVSIFSLICFFSFFSVFDKFLPEICFYWTILLLFEKKWYSRTKQLLKAESHIKICFYLCTVFSLLCFTMPIIHYVFFDTELFLEKKYLSYIWLMLLFCGTEEKNFLNDYVFFSFVLGSLFFAFPILILFFKTGLISSSLSVGEHPSYVSLKLLLGLIFLLLLQYKWKEVLLLHLFFLPAILLFLIVLYALQARITIFIISFLLVSFPFFYYFKHKRKKIFPIFFLLFLLFYFTVEHMYVRKISLADPRPLLWKSSLSTIFSSSQGIFLGLGELDGIKRLNYNYKSNDALPSFLRGGGFGTHNIFLTYWLNFGVFVFMVNFCIWMLGFYSSIRNKNFLLFSVLITFLAFFSVESHHLYFTRTHYFFCFFYFLCLFKSFFKEKGI